MGTTAENDPIDVRGGDDDLDLRCSCTRGRCGSAGCHRHLGDDEGQEVRLGAHLDGRGWVDPTDTLMPAPASTRENVTIWRASLVTAPSPRVPPGRTRPSGRPSARRSGLGRVRGPGTSTECRHRPVPFASAMVISSRPDRAAHLCGSRPVMSSAYSFPSAIVTWPGVQPLELGPDPRMSADPL